MKDRGLSAPAREGSVAFQHRIHRQHVRLGRAALRNRLGQADDRLGVGKLCRQRARRGGSLLQDLGRILLAQNIVTDTEILEIHTGHLWPHLGKGGRGKPDNHGGGGQSEGKAEHGSGPFKLVPSLSAHPRIFLRNQDGHQMP